MAFLVRLTGSQVCPSLLLGGLFSSRNLLLKLWISRTQLSVLGLLVEPHSRLVNWLLLLHSSFWKRSAFYYNQIKCVLDLFWWLVSEIKICDKAKGFESFSVSEKRTPRKVRGYGSRWNNWLFWITCFGEEEESPSFISIRDVLPHESRWPFIEATTTRSQHFWWIIH